MTANGYVSPAAANVAIDVNGALVGTRPTLNVIAGTNVALGGVDNAGSNRVDLTVTSTAGGAGPSGTVTSETAFGQVASAGVAATFSRGDHTHGTPSAPSVPAAATTVTDETSYGVAKVVGTATTYAREDHTHGSPALSSSTPAAETIGAAGAVGVATTPARADHVHAMPGTGTPGSSAVGDAAAAGSSANVARLDHVHGREGFGAVTTQTSYGLSSTNGSATTLSHSDHGHGTPPAPFTAPPFSFPGTVSTVVGGGRYYNDSGRTLTIMSVRSAVGTAPTGQSLICDVNKNGTTIFTTQANRPTIAAAGTTSGKITNMDVTTLADGDYLSVDVDQVGSGVAGSDLVVTVWVA